MLVFETVKTFDICQEAQLTLPELLSWQPDEGSVTGTAVIAIKTMLVESGNREVKVPVVVVPLVVHSTGGTWHIDVHQLNLTVHS